jgi:hypothetical protein
MVRMIIDHLPSGAMPALVPWIIARPASGKQAGPTPGRMAGASRPALPTSARSWRKAYETDAAALLGKTRSKIPRFA